jgi:S1-C subfamily serine protease
MRGQCWHWRLPLLLALMLLTSCSTMTWYERTEAARERSFLPHEGKKLGGVSLERYILTHTAVLFAHHDVEASKTKNGWHLDWESSKPDQAYRGLAVPITNDGYFLTARHATSAEDLKLFLPQGKGRIVKARVVWRHEGQSFGKAGEADLDPDVAIIHVPTHWDRKVQWASLSEVEKGDAVVAGSRNGDPIAGQFWKQIKPNGDDDSETLDWFAHSAPAGPGDSGGPVMLTNGKLLGIHTGAGEAKLTFLWVLYTRNIGIAIAPDRDRVMQVIEKDRAARAATQPAATQKSVPWGEK